MESEASPELATLPSARPYLRRAMAVLGAVSLMLLAWGIVHEVQSGKLQQFDERVLLTLRQTGDVSAPRGPGWVLELMHDATVLGGRVVVTLLVIVASLLLMVMRRFSSAALLLLVATGAGALSVWMKSAVQRPRPIVVEHFLPVADPGFPSGHAMVAAALFLTLGMLLATSCARRDVKIFCFGVAVLITLLIGISRVYLGVHYISDVMAGWVMGTGWMLLCWSVTRRFNGVR